LTTQTLISAAELADCQKLAQGQIKIGNILGYQAYNVGGNDFSFGKTFLLDLQKRAEYPFISANTLDSLTKQPLFKPYVLLKAGTKKFAIIGVTSPFKHAVSGIIFDDPIAALKKYIPKVRQQVDQIIVLAAVNSSDEKRITTSGLEVDFVLIAGLYRYQQSLETVNQTLIARVGTLGKYVGIISVEINDPQAPLSDISSIRTQLEYIKTRLSSYEKNAGNQPLEEFYKDKSAILKTIQDLQKLQQELHHRQATIVNPVDFKLIALNEEIADDPEVRAEVDKLHAMLSKVKISEH